MVHSPLMYMNYLPAVANVIPVFGVAANGLWMAKKSELFFFTLQFVSKMTSVSMAAISIGKESAYGGIGRHGCLVLLVIVSDLLFLGRAFSLFQFATFW